MQEMIFNTLIPELSVKDYEKSIAFYVQTLGFQIAYSREANRFAMILMDTAQIMIEENWYEVNGKKYGNKEFLVQDPDGYLLRFSEDIGIRD
jgi:predicted lactoylglutathione lyase